VSQGPKFSRVVQGWVDDERDAVIGRASDGTGSLAGLAAPWRRRLRSQTSSPQTEPKKAAKRCARLHTDVHGYLYVYRKSETTPRAGGPQHPRATYVYKSGIKVTERGQRNPLREIWKC
jgi:hypothetical protein